MKVKALLTLLFAAAILFVGCGSKSDKDKLTTFTKKSIEFMKSSEFMDMMKKGDQAATEKKMEEIAKDCGFKDLKEVETTADKYKDDPDIKKLSEDSQKEMEAIMTKIMEEMFQGQVPTGDSSAVDTPVEEDSTK